MVTFPHRQHYFAVAGENRDVGSLWMGPFFILRILFLRIHKIQIWSRSDLTQKKLKIFLGVLGGITSKWGPPKNGKTSQLEAFIA